MNWGSIQPPYDGGSPGFSWGTATQGTEQTLSPNIYVESGHHGHLVWSTAKGPPQKIELQHTPTIGTPLEGAIAAAVVCLSLRRV